MRCSLADQLVVVGTLDETFRMEGMEGVGLLAVGVRSGLGLGGC